MSKRSHIKRKANHLSGPVKEEEARINDPCDCPFWDECAGDGKIIELEKKKVKEELVNGGIWSQIVGEAGEKQAEEILDDMVREMIMG
jgi:hypothetical protein